MPSHFVREVVSGLGFSSVSVNYLAVHLVFQSVSESTLKRTSTMRGTSLLGGTTNPLRMHPIVRLHVLFVSQLVSQLVA